MMEGNRPPTIAIVGAPNVGKSTLFNRLLGRRRAIVSDEPGVTRDRLTDLCDLFGTLVLLMDTGGMAMGKRDDMADAVRQEALKAIHEADLIVFLVDARAGLTAVDLEVAGLLRGSGAPIIPVANKIDAAGLEALAFELYRLGLGDVIAVSAEQGRGIDELIDRIRALLPAGRPAAATPAAVPLAIVGRPNVGKSSLFNRIVGDERSLVTPIPGTTRDPVDAVFDHEGTRYRIVDTAGIRRRSGRGEDVERESVQRARQALSQAQLAIAMIDAPAGVEHQDLAILGLVASGRVPAVVAANKWDLVAPDASRARVASIRAALTFAPHLPVLPLSARTGQGIAALLKAIASVRRESERRFATADLNRALQAILKEKQPPADGGRDVRFFYMTQVSAAPPRFLVFGNGRRVPPSYRRFMEGRLRRHLGLEFTPIVLAFRRRSSR